MTKPGDYILWKRYGFRHIIKDKQRTYCGHTYDWMVQRYESWAQSAERSGDKEGAKLLRDRIKYNKGTEHRPTCGTCAKIYDKQKEK